MRARLLAISAAAVLILALVLVGTGLAQEITTRLQLGSGSSAVVQCDAQSTQQNTAIDPQTSQVDCVPFTPTPTATATPLPTNTPTPTDTATPLPTSTPMPPPTPTPAPTVDPTLAITPGQLALDATFNSVGVELRFTGDSNANATATLQFRKTGDTDWHDGLPLWRTNDGSTDPGPAFYGSALLLDPGTSYDVQVALNDPDGINGQVVSSGAITTRAEDIPAASSLVPTLYVDPNGSDASDGATPSTAWKTLQKALQAAPPGAVVQLDAGFYARPTASRQTAITLVAQYPAVDDTQTITNVGQHSVILDRQSLPGDGSWSLVTPDGDPTHPLYKWSGAGPKIDQLGYSDTQSGEPKRVGNWKADTLLLGTPASFATTLYTNKTYNYGFWVDSKSGDLYLRLPPNAPSADPNTLFITIGDGAGLTLGGPDMRVSGLELRTFTSAIQLKGSNRAVVDHNLFSDDKDAVQLGDQAVVENNRIINSNLRFDPAAYEVGGVPRLFIKNWIVLADGTQYSQGRVGQQSETEEITGPARGAVIRFNTFDGNFHSIGRGASSGGGRYQGYGWDITGNLIQHNADDAIESDGATIDWRIWNNRIEYSQSALSTGPLKYGPLYFFRNTAWEIGSNGVPREGDITKLTPGVAFKYSGASDPRAMVYVIDNTLWSDDPGVPTAKGGLIGVPGGELEAGGGGSSEAFYMRNNIFRFTSYAWNVSNAQPWDEDYDVFATTDTTRGLGYHNQRFTSDVQKYRAATGQGAHSNPTSDFITVAAIDSQLVDPQHGDLRLQPGSALIGAGTPIPNLDDPAAPVTIGAN